MRTRVAICAAVAALAALPAAAGAAEVPEGATWSQATFPSSDGVKLHADVLRPKDLPADARTPVILSIGPYFNHSGQTGPAGPVEGTTYDPLGPSTGPSDRFTDFVEGAKLMERGYTFVMVDLRGFGGSSGCLDWGGPGEQADVVNAVRWAASQPWSTGKVGMYGKSYDGVTGLIGANHAPEGLAAVVSQEPVYDLYRYLYGDGIRRLELDRHARAVRPDRPHARPRCGTTRATTSAGSTTPSAPAARCSTCSTRPPTTTTTRTTGARGT